MKEKTRKHGVIFLIAAVAAPVLGILLAYIVHIAGEAISIILLRATAAVNPDAPLSAIRWVNQCESYVAALFFCAFPPLLYSAIVRLITPKAETVYLTPRLSLWANLSSAACGAGIVAALQLFITLLGEDCTASYPNRKIALAVFLPIIFVVFLAFVFVYFIQWNRGRDTDGNRLPVRVIFLDILRGILALPGFCILAGIGYTLLLLMFSDAF